MTTLPLGTHAWGDGWSHHAPAPTPVLAAAGLVLAGGAIAALAHWHGSDLAAQVFRVDLVRQHGPLTWNAMWFGGHHTPGYSVLFPLLGVVLGVTGAGLVAGVAAAACFAGLLGRMPGVAGGEARTWTIWAASLWFAGGIVVNLIVGRLPFTLGLALGLGALLAGATGHRWSALVLTVACPLASPVAGVFVALAWTAWAIAERRPLGLGAAAAAGAPLAVIALQFPEGGEFPFRAGALVVTLGAVVAVLALAPPEQRALRVGAGLYGLGCLATFLVPNALGGNVTRLGAFLVGPLLLVTVPARRRPVVLALAPLFVVWLCSPAIDGVLRGPSDRTASSSYHAPLVAAVLARGGPDARIEVVPTKHHWETAHVAAEVPIARGWERQLDRAYNPELYVRELDAPTYLAWLLDNGVRYVALASAEPDGFAKPEARLVAGGLPYLREVWHNSDWRLWEVPAANPLVQGPAVLVSMEPEEVVLSRTGPGDIVVLVRSTPRWKLDGPGCLAETASGWLVVRGDATARLTLTQGLVGGGPWCPQPDT